MRTWIKLHTIILSDPKMFGMSDHLFRTTMNLLAVAGLEDRDGELGTPDSIAFHLRQDVPCVTQDLVTLSKMGLTVQKKGVWWLTNWEKFQSPRPPSAAPEAVKERVQKSRAQRKNKPKDDIGNEGSNEDVTTLHGEGVTKTEEKRKEEKREEESPPPPNPTAAIQAAYETLLGRKLRTDEWLKQEAAAAKTIGTKYTVEQLRSAYAHYKAQPFWSDKRLTLNYLAKNMPDLLANGKRITVNNRASADNGLKGWN